MDELSQLIGLIYDTILDPDRWTAVLAGIAAYIEAARSLLILEDAVSPAESAAFLSFADPEWVRSYLDTYLMINPMRLATVAQVGAGDTVLTSDFMSAGEYGRSRFAREFLGARDLVDVAVSVLEKTATSITVLSLLRHRDQGFADEAVRDKLRLIGPHVRRATAIGQVLERRRLEAGGLALTLDRLEGAVFLLDETGRVLHANDGARQLLHEGTALRSAEGRLALRDGKARAALAAALAAASVENGAADGQGASFGIAGDGSGGLFGHLVSLRCGARQEAGTSTRAAAALFIRPMRFAVPTALDALAAAYHLTRREMTVLMSIVEVGGVPETAAVLGLSTDTVRSYVKTLFGKTGTRRQADLVKLVAAAASPFTPRRP